MRKLAIAALLSAAVSSPAIGQSEPDISEGNGLYNFCNDESGDYGDGVCMGFIVATESAFMEKRFFCVPGEVRRSQVRDIVKEGLAAHPEERHRPSANLIIKYLARAYPCDRKAR